MGVETDRERLVAWFHGEFPTCVHPTNTMAQCEAWADTVLTSDWLAARDAELAAATREQVLGEAEQAIRAERQRLWEGSWAGTHMSGLNDASRIVANLRDGGESDES